MAYWNRKKVGKWTYLYVYTRVDGRQKAVPRSDYKHLDGAPDHNIEEWVQRWSEQHENKKITPDHILFSDDALNRYLDQWETFLRRVRKRSPLTIAKYRSLLERYAFPFFLEKGLKDPGQWPGVSIRLFDYLESYEQPQTLIAEVNNALRGFFRYLQDEGVVSWEGDLRLRNTPREAKTTPLEFALGPDAILDFARASPNWEIQLMALAGYFCSLRPQEVFSLQPEDFAVEDEGHRRDCSKAMEEAGLYAGLSLDIERQQNGLREETEPKAHSRGWVSCFDREAAHLLVALVNEREPGKQMLGKDNRALYRKWERAVAGTELEGITLKDLRRASLYYLGHHTGMQRAPMHLMKHARHKEFETTLLYLRRPKTDQRRAPGKLKLSS